MTPNGFGSTIAKANAACVARAAAPSLASSNPGDRRSSARSVSGKGSEQQPGSELHLSWGTHGRADRAEFRASQDRVRQTVGRVIGDVEHLTSNFQPPSLPEAEHFRETG